MPSAKSVLQTFHAYGKRSTLHGLSHMYQSNKLWRKIFWLMLTFFGAGFCLYHVYRTVDNYWETPITSVWLSNDQKSTFPDVTFCNLKPASESILSQYKKHIFAHFEKHWEFFDNWFPEERKRKFDEDRTTYKTRLKNLFKKYMEIFWVSDDTRDLGMLDDTMILQCIYNGEPCSKTDFKMVQTYNYWNCYDFHPPSRDIQDNDHDQGLQLILYTDTVIRQNYDIISYKRKKFKKDEMENPYTLKEYLESGRNLNQILAGNAFNSNGLKVIVHEKAEYPSLSGIEFDIPNGVFATIEVSQTNQHTLNRPLFPCNEEDPETIDYVTVFSYNSTSIRSKSFTLTEREAVIQAKQQDIFLKCGCYSHKLPFQFNTSSLCYFAPGIRTIQQSMYNETLRPSNKTVRPSNEQEKKIKCHDEIFNVVESKTYDFMKEARGYRSCQRVEYEARKVQTFWPRMEDMLEFVNSVFLPKFSEGIEFTENDTHKHHILGGINKIPGFKTREQIILDNMINQKCSTAEIFKGNGTVKKTDLWCSDSDLLNNIVRIWVRPVSLAAGLYKEANSYEWPEVLSEIGGIFGLWLGMSLLTGFEFLELFGEMTFSTEKKENRPNADFNLESLPPEIQELLMRALKDDNTLNSNDKNNISG